MKSITKLCVAATFMSTASHAADIDIKIQNLTQGIYFTPFIAVAHSDQSSLYQVGQAASTEMQMMAEGGDISGLSTVATGLSADVVENPAEGLLSPGMSVEFSMTTMDSNTQLTLLSMLLPTNDGFVGLNGWDIPTEAGTYTVYLNGYDAGTEANDEIINGAGTPGAAGIPVAPGGDGGEGATGVTGELTEDSNTMIHIHRGNVGDTDSMGGISDVDSRIHRWLNPVAKVVVTVK